MSAGTPGHCWVLRQQRRANLSTLGLQHNLSSQLCCAAQVRVVHHGPVTLSAPELITLMRYQHTLNNTINWSNKVCHLQVALQQPLCAVCYGCAKLA